ANHPFSRAFSPRRMTAQDCNVRRHPTIPESQRTNGTPKVPWHERPLPTHWTAEEVQFLRNWARELARLNDTLLSTAGDRFKLLRRARSIYFKLAHQLSIQLRPIRAALRRGSKSE